uniref:Uncharacterized protein n=1 Tax=Zea mays TaxID=4577 RepID=A0A804Q8Q4_MAIZE
MIHLGAHHPGNLVAPRRHGNRTPWRAVAQRGRQAVPVAGIVIPHVVKNDQAPLPGKVLNYELMKRAQLAALRARSGDRLNNLAGHADNVKILGDPNPARQFKARLHRLHAADVLHQSSLADAGHPDDGHDGVARPAVRIPEDQRGDPLDVAMPPVEALGTGKHAAWHERAGRGPGRAAAVAWPQPERLPVRRDLFVPRPDVVDLAAEPPRGRGREQQRHLPALLPRRGGVEQVLLELLQLRRAAGLVLQLLDHILGPVLEVAELGQPQLDGAIGDGQALGVAEGGADPPQFGLERHQLVVVDGGRLGRPPEWLQQWRRELLGLDCKVKQRISQSVDDGRRLLSIVVHCRISTWRENSMVGLEIGLVENQLLVAWCVLRKAAVTVRLRTRRGLADT